MAINDKRILYICTFGQSRSRYFAEESMKLGYMSLFCGYDDEADFVLSKNYLDWATHIVILDSYFFKAMGLLDELNNKKLILYYIDDEPVEFREWFINFRNKYLCTT